MSGTGRPKGTIITWSSERKAELVRLAETHSRAEAAEIMGLPEGALKGQAQRMGLVFAGRRRAQRQTRKRAPVSLRTAPYAIRQPETYTNVASIIATSMLRIDPRRADARLRRFSWEAEA